MASLPAALPAGKDSLRRRRPCTGTSSEVVSVALDRLGRLGL